MRPEGFFIDSVKSGKAVGNLLILLFKNRTGGVKQLPAGCNIVRNIVQNALLNSGKAKNLLFGLQPNFRLLPDDAETGAWHIGDYQVKSTVKFTPVLPRITAERTDDADTEPVRSGSDERVKDFPPGAEQASSTRIPGSGCAISTA